MALALVVVTAGGVVFLVLGWMSLIGTLPPNWVAGIRTPYTMRSPENWYAVHRAAAPVLIWSGAAVIAAGLSVLPFALLGKLSDGFMSATCGVLAALMLVSVLAAWLYGTKVARSRDQ